MATSKKKLHTYQETYHLAPTRRLYCTDVSSLCGISSDDLDEIQPLKHHNQHQSGRNEHKSRRFAARFGLFWLTYVVPDAAPSRHSGDVTSPEDQRVPDLITELQRVILCINTCGEQAQSQSGCCKIHTHTHSQHLHTHLPICLKGVSESEAKRFIVSDTFKTLITHKSITGMQF